MRDISRNLLITGASSGIGQAVALEFAKRDGSKNHLILVTRRRDKLEAVAAARMKEQGSGHIIFVSSLAGYTLFPNWSVYCASKWGITAYADVMRQEIAPFGVKISTIHPGPVKTEFFDKNKANVDMSKSEKTMPAISMKEVAGDVYKLAYTNKRRIFNPPKLVLFAEAFRLFPRMMQKMLGGLTE